MAVPFRQNLRIGTYLVKHRLKRTKYYPFIVEIEPLFACNLSCPGCGKIQHPTEVLRQRLSVEDVLTAVEESGTPMVSIAGGEPLLHPQIAQIVDELIKRKIYVYLCTNAVLLESNSKVHALALLLVGHPHGRSRGATRPGRQSRGRIPRSGLGHQGRQGSRLSRHDQLNVL